MRVINVRMVAWLYEHEPESDDCCERNSMESHELEVADASRAEWNLTGGLQ
jgi:hypothetical protein